jgi:heterodisulfide reductase subunit A-like polyferredoxin
MSGIAFMVDEHGKRTAAVIDLRRHGRAWEDFYDTLQAELRVQEPRESLASVKRRLKLKRQRNG